MRPKTLEAAGWFRLGPWTVEPAAGTLVKAKIQRRLRPQEMDLLVLLVKRRGQVVSKEDILDRMWGDAAIEEGALPRCIYEIRKALGDDARMPQFIETLPKRGYRLMAEAKSGSPGPSGPRSGLASFPGPRKFSLRRISGPWLVGLLLFLPLLWALAGRSSPAGKVRSEGR